MQIDVDAGSPPVPPPPEGKPSKKRGLVLGNKAHTVDIDTSTSNKDPTGTDKQLVDFYTQVDTIKVSFGERLVKHLTPAPTTAHPWHNTRQAACH